MNARNEKIEEIFQKALELKTNAELAGYLAQVCPDASLRREVESLLEAHRNPDTVLGEGTIKLEFSPMESPGTRIGRYKLLQQIGEGGMGVVYMAEQEEPVRRRVALKIIKLGMDTRSVVARFEAERQALAMMDHPNIARVLDGGSTDTGRPYFVMELVQGVPMTEYCNKAKISARERLELFIQVCQAIQSAHQKGIIHRDIKPSNVLVTLHDGVPVPKVIDFGIAKATNQKLTEKTLFTNFASMIGTPAYMSPEQAELSGLDIDTRSDIYALGVLLYELLTGSTPFPEKRLRSLGYGEMQRVILEEEPERPSTRLSTLTEEQKTIIARNCGQQVESLRNLLRGDLDWIVMRCLEKDRTRRYETANGLAADLKRHLNNEPVVARPPSAAYKLQKAIRRNKLAFASAGAVAGVLVVGVAVSTWQARMASRARNQEAEANKELRAQMAETQSAKRRADRAAQSESEQRQRIAGMLETMRFQKAEELLAGQPALGVANLIGLLRANPSNQVAAARLTSAILRPFANPMTDPLLHENPVEYAEFNPDGAYVVTVSKNKARVWDAATGREISEVGHEKPIRSAQFSPDGSRIVTASEDKTARIWDVRTGQPLGEPLKHDATIINAKFSSNGLKIVTSSENSTARVWDARTGLELTPALSNSTTVVLAQFVSDGTKVMMASHNGTMTLCDARTGQILAQPSRTAGFIALAQFSPDGLRLVTSVARHQAGGYVVVRNSHDYAARLWNTRTGQPVGEPLRHDNFVICARFSPDGSRVVTASLDKTARVWDAVTGLPLSEPMRHENSVVDAEFSPDGLKVVTASIDKTARVWDAQTGLPLTEPFLHLGEVWSARFSADGSSVVTASDDKTARLWNIRTASPLPEQLRHEQSVNWAEFSPDGSKVVTASQDKTARLWDSKTGTPLADPLRHEGEVTYAQFSPDGSKVVTSSADRTARLWDANTGSPLHQLQHQDRVHWAQFSRDGSKVATASFDQTARVWDTLTGREVGEPFRHQGQVYYAQFSADGSMIATTCGDQARVWNAQTGLLVTDPLRHEGKVNDIEFTPDGSKVVTASSDHTARLWDIRTGKLVVNPFRHDAEVVSALFSPDGNRVVTASADKTARIWDTQTGQEVGAPLRHEAEVNDAEFSSDGSRIVTASADKTARVWDARTGLPLSEPLHHEGPVNDAQFSRDGIRLITASEDARARIWEIPPVAVPVPEWFLDWAESRVGRQLDLQGADHSIPTSEQRRQRDLVMARTDTNLFTQIAQWVETDPRNRTLSPGGFLTATDYAKRLIEENTDASLHTALLLSLNASLPLAIQALTVSHRIAEISRAGEPLALHLEQSDCESVAWARQILRDNHGKGEGDSGDVLLTSAEWFATHALDLDTNQPVAWHALATVQWLRDRPVEALESLDRALALKPDSVKSWELKGDILESQERHSEALEAYHRWIELSPTSEKVQGSPRLQALDKHAAVCRKLGKWNECIADLHAGGVPLRDPATSPRLVDLSAFSSSCDTNSSPNSRL